MPIQLRPWRAEDADSLVLHANNKSVADNLRDGFPHPYTRADAESFLSVCLHADTRKTDFRAIVVDGEAVGGIGLTRGEDVHRCCAELGYWLGEGCWGRGIVSAAVGQICREVFDGTDLIRIFATPFAHNAASCRVLEKAGFSLEGRMRAYALKNGRLLDGFMYALVREDIRPLAQT